MYVHLEELMGHLYRRSVIFAIFMTDFFTNFDILDIFTDIRIVSSLPKFLESLVHNINSVCPVLILQIQLQVTATRRCYNHLNFANICNIWYNM